MAHPGPDTPWFRNHLLLSAAGLILSTALLGAGLLAYLYEQTMREGERLTSAFAAVIGEQTSRTLQAIDLRMERLSDTLADIDQTDGGGEVAKPRIQAAMRASIDALPFVDSLLLIGADGKVTHTSDPTLPEADLSNRDYFTIYRTRPNTGFFIGAPVVGRNSEWLLPIARALGNDSKGNAGVLLANIRVLHFDRLWASLALEADTSVGLLRSDGQMLMRSPIDGSAMGRSFSQSPLFLQHLPSTPYGGYRILSTIDGKDRYIGYRTLAQQPNLVVIVGRTIDAILAPWYRLTQLLVGVWFAASLSLMLLSIRLARQSARRKRAERANAAQAQRFSLASEAAALVLWEWDLASDSWDVTPSFYTSLGYPPQSGPVTRAQWQSLVHPDDLASVQLQSSHIQAHGNNKIVHLFRMRHADTSYRWMRSTGQVLSRDVQGRPTRRIGIRIDVTEHVLAEQQRQQMVERISDALVTISADWRILHANTRAGVLLGRRPDALIGQHVWTVFPDSGGFGFREVYERCMATQKPEVFEEHYAPAQVWYESYIYPSPEGLSVYFRDITERKLSEQALRDAKAQAENLINVANVMVVGLNAQGHITIFNEMAQELTGYTLADLAGRNWFEVLVPRERYPQVHAEFERLATGGLPKHYENAILTATGEERMIAWQNSILRDGDTITGTLSFGIDVTLRRKVERELAESKEQFETLANSSLQGIALIRNSRFVYVNPAYCTITGRSAAVMYRTTVQQVMQWIHPDDRAASTERHQRAAAGDAIPHVNEFRLLTSPDQWRWIQVSTRSITLGGSPAVLGMLLDVHDRHLAEQALSASEERFRSAFDSSGSGMALMAMDGRWMQVNPALCRIVGYTAEELLQRTFMEITHPDDLAADLSHMDDLLAGRVPHFTMEKRYLHRKGHTVWINLTVALVRSPDGSPSHTVAQIEDIDQRKKLENELRESQASLKATIDALPDLLFELDAQGRYLSYHSPRADLLALPPDQFLGRTVAEVMPAHIARRAEAALDQALRDGYAHIDGLQFDLPSGPSWFDLSVSRKDVAGQALRLIVLSHDITRRVRAEMAWRETEERLGQLADNIGEVFWLAEIDRYQLLYVSSACERVIGLPRERLMEDSRSWRVNLYEADRERVSRAMDASRENGHYDLEFRIQHPERGLRWLHAKAFPVTGPTGELQRIAGVTEDITMRKQTETALRQAQQLATVLARRLIDAQEAERRHIARELHDSLGQSLTAVKINLQASLRPGARLNEQVLEENIHILDDTLAQVRHLALGLRPPMLDDLGLEAALQWVIESFGCQMTVSTVVGQGTVFRVTLPIVQPFPDAA